MIAEELINQMIPALKLTDTAEKAIIWMEELKTNQLPVIDNRMFKGLISEDIILENNDLDRKIGDFKLISEHCYVNEDQHLFDIIRLTQECDSELVAILNREGEFMGVSRHEDTIKAFSNTLAVQGQGGILVLELRFIDYSMAEISRLIESDDAKILGSYLSQDHKDPNFVFLTLKINKEDLTTVAATLERFDYKIIAKFHESNNIDTERERLDNLLNFLNI
ncbi:MAG: CBS domain-containing protein [Cyclobacteriaceae bacterium]|nr:CBS domain-containing protein [Cyclobacteriaceae bacterium]MCK5370135.1 CBS domain-containing protein [Cyclobacteriaceae bacterium]MCK5468263.1 CBS domain-containing protein [Cyclobacteriaceae bacterium]